MGRLKRREIIAKREAKRGVRPSSRNDGKLASYFYLTLRALCLIVTATSCRHADVRTRRARWATDSGGTVVGGPSALGAFASFGLAGFGLASSPVATAPAAASPPAAAPSERMAVAEEKV